MASPRDVGSAYALARGYRNWRNFQSHLCRLDKRVDQGAEHLFAVVALEAGLRLPAARVVVSPAVDEPFAVDCFGEKAVYLPDYGFSAQELRHILAHELCHMHRRDAWKKLGLAILKSIFWWNPIVAQFR